MTGKIKIQTSDADTIGLLAEAADILDKLTLERVKELILLAYDAGYLNAQIETMDKVFELSRGEQHEVS